MSSENNFKKLERQELERIGEPPRKIKQNVSSNVRVFHFIGDVFELYFPKIVNLFVKMSGGGKREDINFGGHISDDDNKRPKYPNTFE